MLKHSETLKYPKTIYWFLIANFVIGLIFAFILGFFPGAFLSFVDWPISDLDEPALFGYRMLGVVILGPSFASLFATRKDEWKEINVTMDMECILLLFIKEMHQLNKEYVNKVISEAKIEGDKEKELMGLRMRVLISGDFNPFDMFFNNYKRGFDEIFSLFEKFSNDLFSIYGNWVSQYILERRSIHGINNINDNYKKLLGIDLAMNFKYWKELAKYHYMRNIFIHKDGEIDKDFITNLKKLNLPFEQYKLGDKLQLTSKIFNDAIEIIKKTFSFIKTNLN